MCFDSLLTSLTTFEVIIASSVSSYRDLGGRFLSTKSAADATSEGHAYNTACKELKKFSLVSDISAVSKLTDSGAQEKVLKMLGSWQMKAAARAAKEGSELSCTGGSDPDAFEKALGAFQAAFIAAAKKAEVIAARDAKKQLKLATFARLDAKDSLATLCDELNGLDKAIKKVTNWHRKYLLAHSASALSAVGS